MKPQKTNKESKGYKYLRVWEEAANKVLGKPFIMEKQPKKQIK